MPTPVIKASYENVASKPSYFNNNDRIKYRVCKSEPLVPREKITEGHGTAFIPDYLAELKERIERSKKILSYKYNWDDNGALTINPQVFQRAVTFLESYSERIYDVCKKVLIPPDIAPVNDGSVDLEWNFDTSSFLINFKNSKEPIAFYYGEFKDNDNVIFDTNGQINPTAVNDKFASYLSYLSKEDNS
jgi:hypothetical protein